MELVTCIPKTLTEHRQT